MIALLLAPRTAHADEYHWVAAFADVAVVSDQAGGRVVRPGVGARVTNDLENGYVDASWLDGWVTEHAADLLIPGDDVVGLGHIALDVSGGLTAGDEEAQFGGGLWITDQKVASTWVSSGWNFAAGLEATAILQEHIKIDLAHARTYARIPMHSQPHYALDIALGTPRPHFTRLRATGYLADEPGDGGIFTSIQYLRMGSRASDYERLGKFEFQLGLVL